LVNYSTIQTAGIFSPAAFVETHQAQIFQLLTLLERTTLDIDNLDINVGILIIDGQ